MQANRTNAVKLFILIASTALFGSGCSTPAPNIKPTSLLPNQQVLAGRLLLFKENEKVPVESIANAKLKVAFNKQGDKEVKQFVPDKDGYVWVCLPRGQYNIGHIQIGMFKFNLKNLAVVQVTGVQSVLNFGTLEFHLHQDLGENVTGAIAAGVLGIGWQTAQLRTEYVPNHMEIRDALAQRVGISLPIEDTMVRFVPRAK